MDENRNVEIEKRNVEKKSDSSLVLTTLIKYSAFVVMFFGFLYFIIKYVFPFFR